MKLGMWGGLIYDRMEGSVGFCFGEGEFLSEFD